MVLLCTNDVFSCQHFKEDDPDIFIFSSPEGRIYEDSHMDCRIVVVNKGMFNISYDTFTDIVVKEGDIIMFPQTNKYKISVVQDTEALVFRLQKNIQFCERLNLEWLYDHKDQDITEFGVLKKNNSITEFSKFLTSFVNDGIKCNNFLGFKVRELLFLMRTYYTKSELARFFSPLISNDTTFSDFIFENYTKYKTVQELAEASCYSLSAFNKIFRKTFGVSPYKWMQEQRAKRIYYSINVSKKPLKEICIEHGFSSLSQFSNFCTAHFGMSPRKIKESSHNEN